MQFGMIFQVCRLQAVAYSGIYPIPSRIDFPKRKLVLLI